ncbi:MAG: helix-turn-helix transcriptional regulator [Chloroflexota bacterium]
MHVHSPTRQRVARLLKLRGPSSAAEVARELHLVPVTARGHLLALAGEGLVTATDERGRVGRPRRLYSLSERGEALFPNRYPGLAADVLESLLALAGRRVLDQVLDAAAARYAASHQAPPAGSLAEKVGLAAGVLEAESGIVSWESQPGGFAIRDFNCPYEQLARHHAPEVCRYHVQVVSKLVGEEVSLDRSLARGDRCCLFSVHDTKQRRAAGVRVLSDGREAPNPREAP